MDPKYKTVSDLSGDLKSWIPWLDKSANVSDAGLELDSSRVSSPLGSKSSSLIRCEHLSPNSSKLADMDLYLDAQQGSPSSNTIGMGCKQQLYSDLCDNLWLELFKRLPVKSLCRFRCVCKSWNTLFSSSFFITLHNNYSNSNSNQNKKRSYLLKDTWNRHYAPSYALYQHQDQDNNNVKPILASLNIPSFAYLYQDQDQDQDQDQEDDAKPSVTYLNIPFFDEQRGSSCLNAVGVIHGVVCLASQLSTVFWNPTTRTYIAVKNRYSKSCFVETGFGYNPAKNDFMSVMTGYGWCDVFSVGDATWRNPVVDDVGNYKTVEFCGNCYTNSTIYWIGVSPPPYPYSVKDADYKNTKSRLVLVMFDCERERFEETMELPHELFPKDFPVLLITNPADASHVIDFVKLGTYRDMVSVVKRTCVNPRFRSNIEENESCGYELWAMEDHTKTWSLLYKVDRQFSLTASVVLFGMDLDRHVFLRAGVEEFSSSLSSSSPFPSVYDNLSQRLRESRRRRGRFDPEPIDDVVPGKSSYLGGSDERDPPPHKDEYDEPLRWRQSGCRFEPQPKNGLVFEETLFLGDVKDRDVSHLQKQYPLDKRYLPYVQHY